MAIWRLTAKRDMGHGKIKKGDSATVTTIGSNQKPYASHVQKAFNLGSLSIAPTDANFVLERLD